MIYRSFRWLRRSSIPMLACCLLLLTVGASAQSDSLRAPVSPVRRFLVLFSTTILQGTYSGDRDILASSFRSDGSLEWSSSQPRAVCAQKYREFDPVAIPDSQGGAFLAYTVEQSNAANPNDRDILMRHVDREGHDLWGDSLNRVVVIAQSKYVEEHPVLVRSPDGTIIVFYDVRYGPLNGDIDVAAVKVGPDGKMIWKGGAWIANSKRREHLAGAVSDGRGGAIAVIEVATLDSTSKMTGSDILAAHVNDAGEVGWSNREPTLPVAASRHIERRAAIVGDGYGGAYIAYELEYTDGERMGDVDVFAQHISSFGAREWIDETSPPIVSSNEKAKEYAPSITRDSNGIIVAFNVNFFGEKRPVNVIGVQKLDLHGKGLWYEGKRPKLIGVSKRLPERPQIISDAMSNLFVVFEARDTVSSDRDVYAQRLGDEGDLLWGNGEDPVPVFNSTDNEHDAAALPDGSGGLVIVAVRDTSSGEHAGSSNLVAQRITINGSLPWEAFRSPLQLTSTAQKNGPPVLIISQ